ncbi:hypothetical protein N7519_000963 [Penicillium mononematosum]|uniref:uncharacterized protein n=1 Tax=Penicillium mononematosum TaxID=268346 RepID=UPI0025477227|nr:uncharacterized protein N7519_000963 [Penicillium mononematosum]KAJ6190942.1 hypothetical protein N7519_000963 [Penicillium mononematosum]
MPRPRRPTSTRKSKPRYGMCADEEAPNTARHLNVMNRNAQMELAEYNSKHDLPYYDKLEFDDNGWLVTPPTEHRLSDALVFLIIGQNLIAYGIPFILVFSDYYALVDSHRRKYLWLVSKKVSHAKIAHPGWHIGEIVVSPKKLRPPSDTTFSVDFETYDWSKFTPVPTLNCATKRLLLAFQGSSLL